MEPLSLSGAIKALESFKSLITTFRSYIVQRDQSRLELLDKILSAVQTTRDAFSLSGEAVNARIGTTSSVPEGWSREEKIGQLWRSISHQLRRIDPDLSREVFVKGLFWSDEGQRRHTRLAFVISLSEIIERALKIHPDYKSFAQDPRFRHYLNDLAAEGLMHLPPAAKAVYRNPATLEDAVLLARHMIESGRWPDALAVLEGYPANGNLDPHDITSLHSRFLLAKVLDGVGRSSEALPIIEELIARINIGQRHGLTLTGGELGGVESLHQQIVKNLR